MTVALYTFLSNNPKFREFGIKFWTTVMLQLVAMVFCSGALLFEMFQANLGEENTVAITIIGQLKEIFLFGFITVFIVSWLYLCKIFYVIYGSLYHLRKKRFLKYTKFFGWIYEKFFHKSFYEKNYRQRTSVKIDSMTNIPEANLQRVKNGGTILLLYQDTLNYESFISDYILETIKDKETIDYISTYKSPVGLCSCFSDDQIQEIVKRLSIIDCFSPHYSFDDKVVKFAKNDYAQKGFKFYSADSFAEIHTAANNSWYRFRKNCKQEENMYRIPHRTIYDTVSSLIRFSSEELYFLFLRHVISSEKSYGMISLIMEPASLKDELKNDLIRMADIVIEYDSTGMKLVKDG